MAKMGFKATEAAVLACLQARTTPAVAGAPGIGKSAMLAGLAAARGKELALLVGSTVGDDDIPGTPFVDPRTGNLNQAHRGPLKAAIERPCLLALDEWTTVSEMAQATGLALVLDRRAGDKPLHPDTDVVVLYNPPEHAPGAMRFSSATANRMVTFHMEPTHAEVAEWFQKQQNPYLSEFGVFLSHDPTMVEMQPTPQQIEGGTTWASPRGCERGIRSFGCYADTAKLNLAEGKSDRVAFALIEGSMGPSAAGRYFAMREQRRHLPPLEEILKDPSAAVKLLPEKVDAQVAAISVLPTVCRHDSGAAWLWAKGLQGRFRGAATAVLMGRSEWVPGDWEDEGKRAKFKLIADAVKR